MIKQYTDVNGNMLEPEAYEEKKEYYIKENGRRLFYQYGEFIPYPKATMEESAIAHIEEIIKERAAAEQERVTIEKLHKELTELKTLNSEQDDMIFEQSYEIAMLKLNTASAAV